jgi:hypothetical protein
MNKPTPGKWKVQTAGLMWAVTPMPIRRDSVDICSGSVHNENWKADAALIAAAPELLVALKNVVSWMTLPADSAFDDAQLAAAKAAIRKATKEIS